MVLPMQRPQGKISGFILLINIIHTMCDEWGSDQRIYSKDILRE